MKRVISLAGFILLSGSIYCHAWAPTGNIQTDYNTFTQGLASDFSTVSQWWSDTLCNPIYFDQGSGVKLAPNVLGFPGFEIGVDLGASAFPFSVTNLVNKFNASSYYPASQINMGGFPSYLVLPHWNLGIKVGLPPVIPFGSYDLGFRFSSLDYSSSSGSNSWEYKNLTWGLELRDQLIKDGLASPCALSLNLGMVSGSGTFTASSQYTSTPQPYPINGGVTSTTTGNITNSLDWNPTGNQPVRIDQQKVLRVLSFCRRWG